MKLLEKIILHPKLENEHRNDVRDWCYENFLSDTWVMNSNYTSHGCFNITVTGRKNSLSVLAFIMKFPEVQVLHQEYIEFATIDEEAFSKNFEYI
jgi:hypothetical protein